MNGYKPQFKLNGVDEPSKIVLENNHEVECISHTVQVYINNCDQILFMIHVAALRQFISNESMKLKNNKLVA